MTHSDEAMRRCATGCGRPTRDTLMLCDQCRWELGRALKNLPDYLVDLHDALTKQTKLGEGRAGGVPTKASEQPLPFNVRASQVAADVRVYLVGWVLDLHESHHQRELPPDALPAMARWLHARLHILATHDAAADIHAEITGAYEDVKRAVDAAPNRARFEVGPCPEARPEDGARCEGAVWAYIPNDPELRARMECRHCGTTWAPEQWMKTGRRIRRLIDSDDAGRRLLRSIFGDVA